MAKTNIRVLFFLSIIAIFVITAEFTKAGSYSYDPGEELHYEVSYFGIKLGKLIIKTEKDTVYQGKKVYKLTAQMDTYDGIPAVDLHAKYESWTDKSFTYSYLFKGHTKREGSEWELHQILFEYDKKRVRTEKWFEKKLEEEIVLKTPKKWCDGLSIFYLCRKYISLKRQLKIPTMMGNDTAYTKVNFHGRKQDIEIDAIDYKASSVYVNLKAGWEGVYGVTGDIKAWYSDDASRVPLKAEMKLYVGNVLIELVDWKKKGWNPPKAKRQS